MVVRAATVRRLEGWYQGRAALASKVAMEVVGWLRWLGRIKAVGVPDWNG